MADFHCLTCSHPVAHHVDPTDDLFAVPSIEVHGCHISAVIERDPVDELVDWQLTELPAARAEQLRRERVTQWNSLGRGWP